jgi:hypothetical protein
MPLDTLCIVTDRSTDSEQSPEVNIEPADFFSTSTPQAASDVRIKETAGQLDVNSQKPAISASGHSGLKTAQEQSLPPTEPPPPPVRRDSQEAAFYVDRTPGQLVVSLLAGVLLSGRTHVVRSFCAGFGLKKKFTKNSGG